MTRGAADGWGRREGWLCFAAFVGTVFLANYLVGHVGTTCLPGGPCVIPVWPGVMAPSGVLAAGVGFTLRDLVQRRLGVRWSVVAIVVGAAASAAVSPRLALASGTAFLLSELFDLVVYTPLQRRHLYTAVVASNIVGLVVDSAVFLVLAFGSLELIAGQIVGKLWMTVAFLPVIGAVRRRDARRGPAPGYAGS
ncbi:beta-carotene 15,15'-monooxygenase [bacterium]|nr:VUT family protein [Chloroflexi bacterium CFX6]RIL12336.1 MAG: beta-carotene 15,15'-monooxygenase [bacterium]